MAEAEEKYFDKRAAAITELNKYVSELIKAGNAKPCILRFSIPILYLMILDVIKQLLLKRFKLRDNDPRVLKVIDLKEKLLDFLKITNINIYTNKLELDNIDTILYELVS